MHSWQLIIVLSDVVVMIFSIGMLGIGSGTLVVVISGIVPHMVSVVTLMAGMQ